MRNVYDEPLYYYNSPNAGAEKTSELLNIKDGACQSWVRMFLDVFKAQGMDYQGQEGYITPGGLDESFLVEHWGFLNSPSGILHSNSNAAPFVSMGYTYLVIPHPNYANVYQYQDVYDAEGQKGQNKINPISFFYSHMLAKLNNVIYDPSYGKYPIEVENSSPLSAYTFYEELNIAGFCQEVQLENVNETLFVGQNGQSIDLNSNNIIETNAVINAWLVKKNVPDNTGIMLPISFSNY